MLLQDFATSSLKGEIAKESERGEVHDQNITNLEVYEIAERKRWERRLVFHNIFIIICIKNILM